MIIPNWKAPKHVKAFSTTRHVGCSTGCYEGLNLGLHVGDSETSVMHNRNTVVELLNMPSSPVWLNQTHSNRVIELEQPTQDVLDADGSITSKPNLVCSVMTADCLPVLLCNKEGTKIAAVHAGWRGLADGILENAVKKFDGEVLVWLGPSIGPEAFEVGEDVVEAFCRHDDKAEEAFVKRELPGKWLGNMNLLASQRLNAVGVHSVYSNNLCTYSDSDSFYSYRRDGTTGRQATFIWLE